LAFRLSNTLTADFCVEALREALERSRMNFALTEMAWVSMSDLLEATVDSSQPGRLAIGQNRVDRR
jgi:hypothetical protein